MSYIHEIGKRISLAFDRVILGPETNGVIELVRRDVNAPLYYHILVRTDEGLLKHFTETEAVGLDNLIINKEGFHLKSMTERVGERYKVRTRGTGIYLLPGSKIERDPFNIQEDLQK